MPLSVPNQSTSEACNAPWLQSKLLQISSSMASLVSYGDMDTVDTGSPRAVGRGLPVATVSISHIWHSEAMLQLLLVIPKTHVFAVIGSYFCSGKFWQQAGSTLKIAVSALSLEVETADQFHSCN